MATDTARVPLELASGRNEITAPFHQTAQRRRSRPRDNATSVNAPDEPPPAAPIIVDVPLAGAEPAIDTPVPLPETVEPSTKTAHPSWIAVIVAAIAVGATVWWIMAARVPDIDPREVIARNLNDARTAMADGRYTDPPERSAFHYYSTVLALDPNNADASAGIDAIADRHLTNARVLLADQRVAEAGVALEKARRARPEHNGLAALDKQWREQLRNMFVAAKDTVEPAAESSTKPLVAKTASEPVPQAALIAASKSPPKTEEVAPVPVVSGSAPEVAAPAAATLAATETSTSLPVVPVAIPESQQDSGSNVADMTGNPLATTPIAANVAEPATSPAPSIAAPAAVAGSAEPKLVRMVQPEYPQEALLRGIEGWVEVSLQVSPAGDVFEPRVEQSNRGRLFNRAALAAVQQWKYAPHNDDVASERVRVRLEFRKSN